MGAAEADVGKKRRRRKRKGVTMGSSPTALLFILHLVAWAATMISRGGAEAKGKIFKL